MEGSQLKLLRVCRCYGTMLVNCVPLLFEIRPFKSHQALHINHSVKKIVLHGETLSKATCMNHTKT